MLKPIKQSLFPYTLGAASQSPLPRWMASDCTETFLSAPLLGFTVPVIAYFYLFKFYLSEAHPTESS